jgi:predicted nucleotide-binding protein
LIIADVSQQNPNVFYELGFAHALRKPTILLFNSKSGSGLPSDLDGLQYIAYDPADFRRLADVIKTMTRYNLARRA